MPLLRMMGESEMQAAVQLHPLVVARSKRFMTREKREIDRQRNRETQRQSATEIGIQRETNRQIDRDIEKQRQRQKKTEIQRESETDRQTERETVR